MTKNWTNNTNHEKYKHKEKKKGLKTYIDFKKT